MTAASTLVAPQVAGYSREQAIELSRLCAARPDLCRVALRLWREFVFPALGYSVAVSYQDAALHSGNLYRFDSWARVAFSHSGTDTRSGRPGRDKWIWLWAPHSRPGNGPPPDISIIPDRSLAPGPAAARSQGS